MGPDADASFGHGDHHCVLASHEGALSHTGTLRGWRKSRAKPLETENRLQIAALFWSARRGPLWYASCPQRNASPMVRFQQILPLAAVLSFTLPLISACSRGPQATSSPESLPETPPQELVESVDVDPAKPLAAVEFSSLDSGRLYEAAEEGDAELVKQLIDEGLNINVEAIHKRGSTPLHEAAANGHAEVVKVLVEAGADPNHVLTAAGHKTPLHFAAAIGSLEVCKVLIEAGAELDRRDEGGQTALLLAIGTERSQIELIRLLIQAGADPNIPNRYGKTPLYWATGGRTVEFVDLLIQAGSDVNFVDRFGSTPLHEAATYSDDIATAKALINAGANVNPKPNSPPTFLPRGTPLSIAARKNNIKMVELLASHGADVNVKGHSNNSLLHFALYAGHRELAQVLIESGADVHGRNDAGNPPVQVAAHAGLPELIKLLIEAGSPVNVQDQVGDTPLHDAALQGHVEAARVLVGAGAAVNAKNNRGRTPLDLAEQNNHERLAEVLKAAGGQQGV